MNTDLPSSIGLPSADYTTPSAVPNRGTDYLTRNSLEPQSQRRSHPVAAPDSNRWLGARWLGRTRVDRHVRDAPERGQRNDGIGDRVLRNCPLYIPIVVAVSSATRAQNRGGRGCGVGGAPPISPFAPMVPPNPQPLQGEVALFAASAELK
jgi:hypothetical protein